MNRVLFLIVLSLITSTTLHSQSGNFAKSYTLTSTSSSSMHVKTTAYGNNLFYIYGNSNFGLTIQKNNLSGTPILTKEISNFPLVNPNSSSFPILDLYVNAGNGFLYIAGTASSLQGTLTVHLPFLIKIDTSNCNPNYAFMYPNALYNKTYIYDCKLIAGKSQVLLAGQTGTTLSTPHLGYILNIDEMSGNVNSSYTMSVGSSGNNYIHTLCEISNSSILFGGASLIGKIQRNGNIMSFGSTYGSNVGSGKIYHLSGNPKKIITSAQQFVYKADTNLAMINSSGHKAVSLGSTNFDHFYNDTLYRVDGVRLHVIDSSITSFTAADITPLSQSTPLLGSGLQRIPSGLYITQISQNSHNNFQVLKTNNLGVYSCSTPTTNGSLTITVNGSSVALVQGSITTTSLAYTPTLNIRTTPYGILCSNVGINETTETAPIKLYTLNTHEYLIEGNSAFNTIELTDISGKILEKFVISNKTSQRIDLIKYPSGIYVLKVKMDGQSERILKLPNY